MYIKVSKDDNLLDSFSLVADFDGDMEEMLNVPHADILPVLPLRNMMMFPGVIASVTVGRESSRKVVESCLDKNRLMAVVAQKDGRVDDPERKDLFDEGVVARVIRTMNLPGGNLLAILQSHGAIGLGRIKRRIPVIRAEVMDIPEELCAVDDREFVVVAQACREALMRLFKLSDSGRSEEAAAAISNISNPIFLVNFICTNMKFTQEERYSLLQKHDIKERAMALLELLKRECQLAELKQHIEMQTRQELDTQQRQFFLHQQIKNIRSELGEDESSDIDELQRQADESLMPDAVRTTFKRELDKLARLNQQSPEYNVQYSYLQTVLSLPWGKNTPDNLQVRNVKRELDQDHYGLEKVKERILEYLATLNYSTNKNAPILCLVGPPGVGKTSLGRSIAHAMGRKYMRISLGGVNDEAEIRGHRRTYIGAMPGRIVKGIIKAGSENPLFVLDEIDKVAERNINGDPHSALLEVLDPEQNATFHDNYLDIDYDLSKVFFIATANSLQTIPTPLLDRMEVIEVEGYLTEEKKEIARRHLIKKEQKDYDFGEDATLQFSPSAIEHIIEHYTRESGVRGLEKQISKIFRKVAYLTEISEDGKMPYAGKKLKPKDIEKLLGKPIFTRDIYTTNKYAGVVTGLAWTAVGGEILFIETGVSRSKGAKLTLTGNLGDVMKESAMLALEYVRSHAGQLGIDYRVFDCWGIHIHVPEGATPKDGPSAGITIATSIASALTQRKVRDHVAMTGEITLRGHVLPVGGIKEKILAAKRAGITDILISRENRKDVEEVNKRYVEGVTFHYVEDVKDVLDYALTTEKVEHPIDLIVEEENAPAAIAAAKA